MSYLTSEQQLFQAELRKQGISRSTIAAMLTADRKRFMKASDKNDAYNTYSAFATVDRSTISSPQVVGLTTDLLSLDDSVSRVLDASCGVGFQTAVIALLTSPTTDIIATDISHATVRQARQHLITHPNINIQHGDAVEIGKKFNPFDRIVCSVAVASSKIHALLEYLNPNGILVAPVSLDPHHPNLCVLTAYKKEQDNYKIACHKEPFVFLAAQGMLGWKHK